MSAAPILTILTLTPLLGAIFVFFAPTAVLCRRAALFTTLLVLGLTILTAACFNPTGGFQFQERHEWFPAIGAEYRLGVDGLGMTMAILTAIVVPLSLLLLPPEDKSSKGYCSLFLLLQSGLFGSFTALNFFHWFLFWELSLIPAFFLIKQWGGGGRGPAAARFFIYTMAGSVAMLLGFLALFIAAQTMDFTQLAAMAEDGSLSIALAHKIGWSRVSPETAAGVVFVCVLFGLAVKTPMYPFHTWLPSAYSEAPTGTTMVLTGVMSKMGAYGFLRLLLPIFPDQIRAASFPLLLLAVASIVAPAFAALAQKNLKRMMAYSSVNHLGYCLLGVFAAAAVTGDNARLASERAIVLNGVVLQMFNHGISASAIFGFLGLLERRCNGLGAITDFGGLRKPAPVFAGLMGIALFSSLGLPGLNGFVGEFLIFKGVFSLAPWAAGLSALGLLVTAIYILTLIQKVFAGPLNPRWAAFEDLSIRERCCFAPMIALMFVIGICPQFVMGLINSTAASLAAQISK